MSKYGSLLKKTEVFEKLAVYGNKNDFLKSLSQVVSPNSSTSIHNPSVKKSPSASEKKTVTSPKSQKLPVTDTVVYPKTDMIVHPTGEIKNIDPRYDTEGYEPHNEMLDIEDLSEKEREILNQNNTPIYYKA